MSDLPVPKLDSLELPPDPQRPSLKEAADTPMSASTSSIGVSKQNWSEFPHLSVATLRGLTIPRANPISVGDKPKGEKARSLLRMLLRSQKAPEDSGSGLSTDVNNLIPCGDVVGLLAVSVKLCKDFTPRFNVKRDTHLLIRISIDKIMKCTNPQVYRAKFRARKKINQIYFGDVRYFSVKVPQQKSDPRNRIVLELVGFEGPKDFPRLFGTVTMHLYEVIQKQSFTEAYAMRIRNTVFCTVEVEFMFCYGCLGYGYSHQLKLPGIDPAKAVAYSMFLRVPPPEERKDHISNAIKPQRMNYPAFLSPDLNVTVGNIELESPTEISDLHNSLQTALQEPPRERLERMKQEYRSLKTWPEKADYLDQLILKRGPKTKQGQTKVSRFKDVVGKIQHPVVQQSSTLSDIQETVIKQEEKLSEIQKWASVPQDIPSSTFLEPPPSYEETKSEAKPTVDGRIESAGKTPGVPTLTITSTTTTSPVTSDDTENPVRKFKGGKIHYDSETSLSSDGGITETGDLESPAFNSKAIDGKNEKKCNTDSVAEAIKERPSKAVEFREAVFSGSRFEPFLRHISGVPAPFPIKNKADEMLITSHLDKSYSSVVIEEREDQDPPHRVPLTETDSSTDAEFKKGGEQLSILRLIERKMELEEEDQILPVQDGEESKAVKTDLSPKPSGQELLEAEAKEVYVSFRRSLEDVLVDRLVKAVVLKSLLSKNVENLVAEKLSEAEISQVLEDSSPPNSSKPDMRSLKAIVSQNLQACLMEKLSEQGIIPDLELAENDQKVSFPNYGDLHKLRKYLSKEKFTQAEIVTLKSFTNSQSGNSSKTELLQRSKESSKESQSVITKTHLSESKIGYERQPALLHKSQSSSGEGTDARDGDSTKSLEIIRVIFPSTTETELTKRLQDNIKQPSEPEISPQSSKTINDTIIEKLLKAEITSLKSCLSERVQDHLKDKLSETELSIKEDLQTVCQNLPLHVKAEHKMAPEKDLLERGKVSSQEGLAEACATKEVPVLNESIQNVVLEALSGREIVNLNSLLSTKIQDNLLERLSEIGLITETELQKILENLFSVVAKETPPKRIERSDVSKEEQIVPSTSSQTQSLQDRFSEEELNNVKSLLSRLLKKDCGDTFSESEVKGLQSILQKRFEDLPIQNSSETGISKEVEIKDECHNIPMPNVEKSASRGTDLGASSRGKDYSKESKIYSRGEKNGMRREHLDISKNNIFEVETTNKKTQTNGLMCPSKKAKHSFKKECHRLQNYPNKQDMTNSKKEYERVLKNKPSNEALRRISEPYACSSFLSAHDIGIQTETKSYFSNPPNYLSKPTFPVNPQTFLFLHSESEEEAKSASKANKKLKSRKKPEKSSKDTVSHEQQPPVMNTKVRKERINYGSSSKEALKEKGRKHVEPSPNLSMTENRKDSKIMAFPNCVRKGSLKQKSEMKQDEVKPKTSLSRSAALSVPQLQDLAKNLEKPSAAKYPASGLTKGKAPNPGGTDEVDVEAFKHLEKAIIRALHDLRRAPEGSTNQVSHSARPYTSPSAALVSKEACRSPSTNSFATENPRNLTYVISELLENQEKILNMTPEQLEVVLNILKKKTAAEHKIPK